MTSIIGAVNPRGPVAESMADLWRFTFFFGSAVFVMAVLLVIGLFRRRAPSEPRLDETTPQGFGR